MAPLFSLTGNECKRLWLLKNSLKGISAMKVVRKLLNVRSLSTLKFTEITALVPFSTATPVNVSNLSPCFPSA
jgi:hypothetical protein